MKSIENIGIYRCLLFFFCLCILQPIASQPCNPDLNQMEVGDFELLGNTVVFANTLSVYTVLNNGAVLPSNFTLSWSWSAGSASADDIQIDGNESFNLAWPCNDWFCEGSLKVSILNASDVELAEIEVCVHIYSAFSPLIITGESEVCAGSTHTYLLENDISPYATLIWNFPYSANVLPQSDLDNGIAVVEFNPYGAGGDITLVQQLPPGSLTENFTVSMTPLPQPCTGIQGPSVVCSGFSTTFTAFPIQPQLGAGIVYDWFLNGNPITSNAMNPPTHEMSIHNSQLPGFGAHTIEAIPRNINNDCGYGQGCQHTFYIAPPEPLQENLTEVTVFDENEPPENDELLATLVTKQCGDNYTGICSEVQVKYEDIRFISVLDLGENYNIFNPNQEFNYTLGLRAEFYAGELTEPVQTITYNLDVSTNEPEQYFVWDITPDFYSQFSRIRVFVDEWGTPENEIPLMLQNLRLTNRIDKTTKYKVPVSNPVLNYGNVQVNSTNSLVTFNWNNLCDFDFQNYEFQLLRLYNINPDNEFTGNEIVCIPDWKQALTIETQSAQKSITLNITEGTGYYAWRVRPIGNYYEGGSGNSRNFGQWTNISSLPTIPGESAPINTTSPGIAYFDNLDMNRNWIYSRVFTEAERNTDDGVKVFESIQYANGLNMPYQSQTIHRSDGFAVVQQNIYDYLGRPMLSTLPVPLPADNIGYFQNLVKSESEQSTYKASDYDQDSNMLNPDQVLTDSEADLETSPFNYYTQEYSMSEFNGTLPNSEGYPFTRAINHRGMTGKMKEQGGTGFTHKLKDDATSRSIKTLIVNASDDEVIRVFGDEAPLGESVLKTIVYDQNRQANVTYTNKAGQVIATCLSITDNVDNPLLPLLSQEDEDANFSVNQLLPGAVPMQLYLNSAQSNIALTEMSNVYADYVIYPSQLEEECGDICEGCDYHVNIYLVHIDEGTIIEPTNQPEIIDFLGDCGNPDESYSFTLAFMNVPPGAYQVVKQVHNNNPFDDNLTYVEYYQQIVAESLQAEVDWIYDLVNDYIVQDNDIIGFYNAILSTLDSWGINDYNGLELSEIDHILIPVYAGAEDSCGIIEIPVLFCPESCPFIDEYGNINEASIIDYTEDIIGESVFQDELHKFFGDIWQGVPPGGGLTDAFENFVENMLTDGPNSNDPFYSCEEWWECWQSTVLSYDLLVDFYDSSEETLGFAPDFTLIGHFLECTGYNYIGYASDPGNLTSTGALFGNTEDAGYLLNAYSIVQVTEDAELALNNFNSSTCDALTQESETALLCACMLMDGFDEDYMDMCYPGGIELEDYVEVPQSIAAFTSDNWYHFMQCQSSIEMGQMAPDAGNVSPQDFISQCQEMCDNKADAFAQSLHNLYYSNGQYVQGVDEYYVVENLMMDGAGYFTSNNPIDWNELENEGNLVTMEEFGCNLTAILDHCYSHCQFTIIYDENDEIYGLGTPEELEMAMHLYSMDFELAFHDSVNNQCPPNDSLDTCMNNNWTHLEGEGGTATLTNLFMSRGHLVQALNGSLDDLWSFVATGGPYFNNVIESSDNCPVSGEWYLPGNINSIISQDNTITLKWCDWTTAVSSEGMHAISSIYLNNTEFSRCFVSLEVTLDVSSFVNGISTDPGSELLNLQNFVDPEHNIRLIDVVLNAWGAGSPHRFEPKTPGGAPYTLGAIDDWITAVPATFTDWFGFFELTLDEKLTINVSEANEDNCNRSYYFVEPSGCSPNLGSLSAGCPGPATADNAFMLSNWILDGHPSWDVSCNSQKTFEELFEECRLPACGNICFRWKPFLDAPPDSVYILTCEDMAYQGVLNSLNTSVALTTENLQTAIVETYNEECANVANLVDSCVVSYEMGYHHYTLYYYDRANNLIKTVPPKGVELQDLTDEDVLNRQIHPNHTFVTEYYYNSLQQLRRQNTPDGGETRFYYNSIGQLRFSQNAEQVLNNRYTYTKYDKLSRIIQTGEALFGDPLAPDAEDFITSQDDLSNTSFLDDQSFPIEGNQRATNHYTLSADVTMPDGRKQRFLSNRISYTETDEGVKTYYSYDPHGNVEWMIQQIPGLGKQYLQYEYDLVSGNVLEVAYNKGKIDQFFHRYSYDADNRIIAASTSKDGVVWDRDARYRYYPHGPLRRTLIGEDEVQGLDFVYTLQGWLKGINHPSTNANLDPSKDGLMLNGSVTATDAFGMILNYFAGDFPVAGSAYESQSNFTMDNASLAPESGSLNLSLYNGNISSWSHRTELPGTESWGPDIAGNVYQYDELHRIKHSFFSENSGSGWSSTPNAFNTEFSYDANGNILRLIRHNASGSVMDNIDYDYPEETNRLNGVLDEFNMEADDFYGDVSYSYDAIGNLVGELTLPPSGTDVLNRMNVHWNVQGKIKKIHRIVYPESDDPVASVLHFKYDASGNRVFKKHIMNVNPNDLWDEVAEEWQYDLFDVAEYLEHTETTFYVRDAQGNVMGTYKRTHELDQNGVTDLYKLTEQPIYGSSRLGLYQPENLLVKSVYHPDGMASVVSEMGNWVRITENNLYPINTQYNIPVEEPEIQVPTTLLFNPTNESATLGSLYFGGIAGSAGCVAENEFGEEVFRMNTIELAPGGGENLVWLFKEGEGLFGVDDNIECDAHSSPMAMKAPGNNNYYYLFTVSPAPQYNLLCHVIDVSENLPDVVISNVPVAQSLSMRYYSNFALMEDHTAPNKSRLFAKRRNLSSLENEYIQVVVQDFDLPGVWNVESIFQTEDIFHTEYMGSTPRYAEEMQISPDGSMLASTRNGGLVFNPQQGGVMLFMLPANEPPQWVNQLFTASPNWAVVNVDFTPGSSHVFYTERSVFVSNAFNPVLLPAFPDQVLRRSLFTGTTQIIGNTEGGVRRLADGRMYFRNAFNNNLWQISNPDDATPVSTSLASWGSGAIANFLVNNAVVYGLAANQPHRIYPNNNFFTRKVGKKHYELTDHLSNVRATITDRKIATIITDAGSGAMGVIGYSADITSAQDYYPFGWTMPGRKFNPGEYRYGFQGQETDGEIKGEGNSVNFKYRVHDPRLGRFLSVDPLASNFAFNSPYSFSMNRVIDMIELEGAEVSLPAYVYENGGYTTAIETSGRGALNEAQADMMIQSMSFKPPNTSQTSQTYIRDASAYSSSQYKFIKSNIDTYGDALFPKDVALKLARGEDVTAVELGIEALGIIPAGKIIGKALKGAGGDILQNFVKKFDNQASHLTDSDVSGALKDIFNDPVVINGKTYDHLTEVEDALSGMGRQLNKLNKSIDAGEFSGEVLDNAKTLRSSMQKQKDQLQNVLNKAKKTANKE